MLIRIAAVVCLAAMLSGCGGVSSPSNNQNEPFTGAVPSGGVGPVHTFNVSKVGEFSVVISQMTPQNIYIGMVYGQPAGNGCTQVQVNYAAHLNAQALGGQIEKGTWCVQLADVGYIPANTTATYTVNVSHP